MKFQSKYKIAHSQKCNWNIVCETAVICPGVGGWGWGLGGGRGGGVGGGLWGGWGVGWGVGGGGWGAWGAWGGGWGEELLSSANFVRSWQILLLTIWLALTICIAHSRDISVPVAIDRSDLTTDLKFKDETNTDVVYKFSRHWLVMLCCIVTLINCLNQCWLIENFTFSIYSKYQIRK